MRKLVIVLIYAFIAANGVSQEDLGYLFQNNASQYNWRDVIPKGKIKRYKESHFFYDQSQGQYIPGSITSREFDTNRQLVRERERYSNFKRWTNFYYNSPGQIKIIDDIDTIGNVGKREYYKYDNLGRVIRWEDFFPDTISGKGKDIIKYEGNEKITFSARLYTDTNMFPVDTTKYDSRGRWVERDRYSSGGLNDRIFVEYNDVGNIISCKVFGDGYQKCGWRFKCDDKGNITEEIQDSIADPFRYYLDGFHPGRVQFIYKYDKNENWTEKQEIDNGIPYSMSRREIEYY